MSTPLGGLPRPPLLERPDTFTSPWAGWFSVVQQILQACSLSGTTTQRPPKVLYIGQQYFDTTLGIAIWSKAAPTPSWVDATGTPA